jgi:hypothetical protein
MNGVALSNFLSSVQFLEAPTGRRLAVLDADDWMGMVEWFEEVEDRRVIQADLERLRAEPENSGAVPLETIQDESDDPFEQFIGAISSTVPDWGDRHDEYTGQALMTR